MRIFLDDCTVLLSMPHSPARAPLHRANSHSTRHSGIQRWSRKSWTNFSAENKKYAYTFNIWHSALITYDCSYNWRAPSRRPCVQKRHNCTRTSQSHHHYVQKEEWRCNSWQSILDAMPSRKPLFLGRRQTSPKDTRRSCHTIDVGDARVESHLRSIATYRCGR